MSDPLAQLVGLLQPQASSFKQVNGVGHWAVRPSAAMPFYGAVLEGHCELSMDGQPPVTLSQGDFLLMPAVGGFLMTSPAPPPGLRQTPLIEIRPGILSLGEPGTPELRMLVGFCSFNADDSALLVSLLPRLVVVRDDARLTTFVQLLGEESGASLSGREAVLNHLLEVILIEAFRTTSGPATTPGLLRGLADERLAPVLRKIHEDPARDWRVAELTAESALSRSAFFERFRRQMGMGPMEYLLGLRMALAKDLLRRGPITVNEVAQRVGYHSQSAFNVAFTRRTGVSPTTYARAHSGNSGEVR